MDLQKRKSNRLKHYDYSANGGYFLTICTRDKICLLGDVVGGGVLDTPKMKLSDVGIIVKNQLDELASVYKHLDVVNYVVMPNHVHLLVLIHADCGTSRTPSPTNASIPQLISTFKRFTNKTIGCSIWQRGYHDHIVRNEQEYQSIWEYIDTNPHKWTCDRYYK